MSENTPSPALRAGEGWGEGAANAAEPQPETQSATNSHQEAQSRAEQAESYADEPQSRAEEAEYRAEEARSPAEEVQSSPQEPASPAEEARFPAEEAQSPSEEPDSPDAEARSPAEVVQTPAEVLAEALPSAEQQPESDAIAGDQPTAEPGSETAPAAVDADSAAPPAETPAPTDTAPDEDSLRLAEALVFASAAPVSARALSQLLPANMDADAVIVALRDRYAGRGVELVETAGGIQFRTAPDLAPRLRKVIEVPRKLPRVAMEVLAIIAYHQPCTRADIEEIRGTSLSQQTLDALLEANLVAPKGRREVPGRPTLWGTTPQFLAQFGLKDIRDLPQRGDLLLEPPKPSGVSDAPPLAADLSEPPADTISAEETGSAALSQG